MKSKKDLLWSILSLYGAFYTLLYFGYGFIIHLSHASYSVISISAILLPFVFLLFILLVLWKYLKFRNKEKIKIVFLSIIIVGVIPPLYCIIMMGLNENKANFTTGKWMENPSGRVYIVDNLVNTYELKGKTKREIHILLGKPTENAYFEEDDNIVYYLGDERGLISIDSEWLVISFNNREKVVKYEILTD